MPIIPGSALKGLAAHYCDQVWGERHVETPSETAFRFRGGRPEDRQQHQRGEPAGEYHQLLFSITDDCGCITFHDAWLTPDSLKPLVLDVMTPHHPKWIDGSDPPTDFDSPKPVPFLAVSGTFRVAVSWHGPASNHAKGWTELALSLVCDAVKEWGIGGKTSSGYGRMVDPKDARFPKVFTSGVTATALTTARRSGSVRVKFLGPHDKLKNAFWVQEAGKKRGLLKYGTPPGPLPPVDSEIEVYPTTENPNSPEYRWDAPLPRIQPKGGPGGKQPRGRR